jgi:tRNA threonylcarbamoyl adenosine modification protein (Sua5/YciO/YrdC/YwlC family)
MSQFFRIHPETPQHRLIHQAAEIVRGGGVIAYPTDSAYAIGCHIGDKNALTRIRQLRKLEDDKNFTLVCEDLSALGTYARVSNSAYRMIRSATPGPYTFIFPATKEVPRRLVHPKRKTIGVRVPDNAICTALLRELGEPLMSATLIMPGEQDPLSDAYEIRERLEHQLDLVIDGGYCGPEPTTVISFEQDVPSIVRAGRGDVSSFTS